MRVALYTMISLIFVLIILYFCGPVVTYDTISTDHQSQFVHADISDLDSLINAKEATILDLKPDNQARIVWYDSIGVKTNISLLYIHGFSASQEEGDPIHEAFAERYGANLYLARLYDHGRSDTSSFEGITPQKFMDSAIEAVDIATKLGDTLIVMSCSTGGTLASYLSTVRDDIDALIMYSPNLDLHDKNSNLLKMHWGSKVAEFVFGGNFNRIDYEENAKQYWNPIYHTDGVFMVRNLLDQTMTNETFERIDIPVYLGYYFQTEELSDHVISIPRIREFNKYISTPDSLKKMDAFPDTKSHVITSWMQSKDVLSVRDSTFSFAENVLKISPKVK